jgi:hypothetical protein
MRPKSKVRPAIFIIESVSFSGRSQCLPMAGSRSAMNDTSSEALELISIWCHPPFQDAGTNSVSLDQSDRTFECRLRHKLRSKPAGSFNQSIRMCGHFRSARWLRHLTSSDPVASFLRRTDSTVLHADLANSGAFRSRLAFAACRCDNLLRPLDGHQTPRETCRDLCNRYHDRLPQSQIT